MRIIGGPIPFPATPIYRFTGKEIRRGVDHQQGLKQQNPKHNAQENLSTLRFATSQIRAHDNKFQGEGVTVPSTPMPLAIINPDQFNEHGNASQIDLGKQRHTGGIELVLSIDRSSNSSEKGRRL